MKMGSTNRGLAGGLVAFFPEKQRAMLTPKKYSEKKFRFAS
jgi:hypothetical protein